MNPSIVDLIGVSLSRPFAIAYRSDHCFRGCFWNYCDTRAADIPTTCRAQMGGGWR